MTSEPPNAVVIGDEILRALRRILRRVTLHSRQLSRETGLTVPQVLCLRALADAPDACATQVDLSRALQLTSPTVVGIVDRLEHAGLVRRERGTTDRRKVYVSLTGSGHSRLASLPAPLQERFLERLMELPAAEQDELLRNLNRIVELMEAESIEASPILVSDADVKPAGTD
jgi:DNA-binding MarR family transcriptional regulator